MNWISTALLSTMLGTGVSIIDSHLLSRRMLGLRPFMLAMGIIQLFYILVLYILFPWPTSLPVNAVLSVIGASIAGTSSALITMFVLQSEEVSRVVPIIHISPIFVAIIATVFLGEDLGYLQWLAIVIVVAGALIITAEKRGTPASTSLKRPFSLLFVASLLSALASIFTKYTLSYISFWNMYSMALLGTAITMLGFSLRPATVREWIDMERRNSTIIMVFLNEIAALSASVIFVRAVSLGPVSLVSTITGTRPAFVAVFSMILKMVLPGFLLELPGKRVMALRFIAIALIVGGLSIISLTGE